MLRIWEKSWPKKVELCYSIVEIRNMKEYDTAWVPDMLEIGCKIH
jgi:hypothetical protein